MMNNRIWKKIVLFMPLIVLLLVLFYIDHTVAHFKEMAYTFVYNTNVGSVQRYSKEMAELESLGYIDSEHSDLYTTMLQVYNKTLGEKVAIITFLLDGEKNIYHSTVENEKILSEYLGDPSNLERVKQATSTPSGEVRLYNKKSELTMYYQTVTNGEDAYYLFMGVDKQGVDAQLNPADISTEIGIIGLLILVITEYAVWLKISCMPCDSRDEGS